MGEELCELKEKLAAKEAEVEQIRLSTGTWAAELSELKKQITAKEAEIDGLRSAAKKRDEGSAEEVGKLVEQAKLQMETEISAWVRKQQELTEERDQLLEKNAVLQENLTNAREKVEKDGGLMRRMQTQLDVLENEKAARVRTSELIGSGSENQNPFASLTEVNHLPLVDILNSMTTFTQLMCSAPLQDGGKPFELSPEALPFCNELPIVRTDYLKPGKLEETVQRLSEGLHTMKTERPEIFGEDFIDVKKIEDLLAELQTFPTDEFGDEKKVLETALSKIGWSHLIQKLSDEWGKLNNMVSDYKQKLEDPQGHIRELSIEISKTINPWEFEEKRNAAVKEILERYIEKQDKMDEAMQRWETFGGFEDLPPEVQDIKHLLTKRRKSIETAQESENVANQKHESINTWLKQQEEKYQARHKDSEEEGNRIQIQLEEHVSIFIQAINQLGSTLWSLAQHRQDRQVLERNITEIRSRAIANAQAWKDQMVREEGIKNLRNTQAQVLDIGEKIFEEAKKGAQRNAKHVQRKLIQEECLHDDVRFSALHKLAVQDTLRQKTKYELAYRQSLELFKSLELKLKRKTCSQLPQSEFKKFEIELEEAGNDVKVQKQKKDHLAEELIRVQKLNELYRHSCDLSDHDGEYRQVLDEMERCFFTAEPVNVIEVASPDEEFFDAVDADDTFDDVEDGFQSPLPWRKGAPDDASECSGSRTPSRRPMTPQSPHKRRRLDS